MTETNENVVKWYIHDFRIFDSPDKELPDDKPLFGGASFNTNILKFFVPKHNNLCTRLEAAEKKIEQLEFESQAPPCSPTCYHHQTHPCEKCGRINGFIPDNVLLAKIEQQQKLINSMAGQLDQSTEELEGKQERIEQQQNCIRELIKTAKAFKGLTKIDTPAHDKLIKQAEEMIKPTTEKTKTKERIITKEYEGVRCGHCGGRSKIGEVWLISEKDWIGDNPICYGHKRCIEDAIAKAEELIE